jgi:hypothetical protein
LQRCERRGKRWSGKGEKGEEGGAEGGEESGKDKGITIHRKSKRRKKVGVLR